MIANHVFWSSGARFAQPPSRRGDAMTYPVHDRMDHPEIQAPPTERSTVFEGARLITGDGSAPIEDSIFMVANGVFSVAGRRSEVQVPTGATRVDLTGKTVMPAMVDLHGHLGFQDVPAASMSKEM